MFKSIVTTALRNLLRNRSFSFINLFGLSVSMSLGLLIILVVNEQFTFDNFHADSEQIYRVNTRAIRTNGDVEPYASSPLPLAKVLTDEYSFADKVVRLHGRLRGDVTYGNVNVPLRGLLADPSFLEVFNFPLEKGDATTALNDPNSLVLTQEAAVRIFGTANPLGQTISMSGYGEFQITGVLKKFISKTHFDFEALGSMSALPLFEKEGKTFPSLEDWNNYYSGYVYFKLKPGHHTDEIENALTQIPKKYYSNLKLETRDKAYEFYLHPLSDITPGPELSNQMGNGMPDMVITFLSFLVGIVMLMACFNYTNLMIAKSLSRAREIGVRKVVGANRLQVFLQFSGEAIVFSLIALIFSYLILQFLKPAFMQLNIAREFSAQLGEDYTTYLQFILFAIGIGFIAGLLPASYLSSFRPASVLKDSSNLKVYSRVSLRQGLIALQFTLSLMFIIVVLVIYNQVNYMLEKDYGINDQGIMNIRLQGTSFDKMAHEAEKLPGVVSVGGISHPLGTWEDRSNDYKRNREDEPFVMRDFVVNAQYINQIELKFVAGRNFDMHANHEAENQVILNEKALPLFNLSDPVSAPGQVIYSEDSVMLTIIGVVKDFHFRPLNYEIGPLALRFKKSDLAYLSARISPGQKEAVTASLRAAWKTLDHIHPFEMKMMDEEIDQAYTDAGFKDIVKVVGYICFVAVSLSCLGMLGMAMYSTQTRTKEIGVRKVMGASATQITFLLSKSFLYLIGIAVVVGTPIGYFLGEQFIESYAYKTPISLLLITSSIFIILLLGILTIGSQTWRAASANPVKALKYE